MFFAIYLVNRFFYRLFDFFHHWYYHGSRWLAYHFFAFLETLDRTLAIKITLKYFFQPLYKDYTVIGRVMGVIFRSIRVCAGAVVYLFFAIVFLAIYCVWIAFPPAVVFLIIISFDGTK